MGLNSVNEALLHGVPLIGVPVYADQPMNMAMCIERGAAFFLNRKTLDAESLANALKEVLFSEK